MSIFQFEPNPMNWHNELGQIAREQASPSLHIADKAGSEDQASAQLISKAKPASIYSLLALELLRIF
jgi:hypothetical protein